MEIWNLIHITDLTTTDPTVTITSFRDYSRALGQYHALVRNNTLASPDNDFAEPHFIENYDTLTTLINREFIPDDNDDPETLPPANFGFDQVIAVRRTDLEAE